MFSTSKKKITFAMSNCHQAEMEALNQTVSPEALKG